VYTDDMVFSAKNRIALADMMDNLKRKEIRTLCREDKDNGI